MQGSLAGLLLAVFALGTLVEPLYALKFNFTDVQQCDPIFVKFKGTSLNSTSPRPTTLSILPIIGSAIDISLPNPFVASSGIYLNFVPFPVGSNYLASLNDETGGNVIFTSDLMRVLPSESNNSTCLSPSTVPVQQHFSLYSNPSQCQNFSISYNTSYVSQAPSVRLYVPKGPSYNLNPTADDPETGKASYLMQGARGVEILMLIDDGQGNRETTSLLTVGGDSASDKSCLPAYFTKNSTSASGVDKPMSAISQSAVGSKAIIIGGASGGAAVLLVIGCMIIFITRERRRRRRSQIMSVAFDREKMTIPQIISPRSIHSPKSPLANPIYTMASASLSNNRDTRSDMGYPIPGSSSRKFSSGQTFLRSSDNMSIQSLDIEGMLNMATLQTENNDSRKNSSVNLPAPFPRSPSSTLIVPASTLRVQGSRRHMRGPADVPHSIASVNPFDTNDDEPRIASGISDVGGRNNHARSPFGEPSEARPPSGVARSEALGSGKSTDYGYGLAM